MSAAASSFLSPHDAARDFLNRLQRPARLLIAISGGSDSSGLLSVLLDCHRGESGGNISLFAATVDHGLRPESAQEARAVAELCRSLNVPHLVRRWEGSKPATGVSAAAREARYRLLMEMADEVGATAIVTGHTWDDQRETVAMRAARRDGDENLGLAGMAEAVLLDRRRWLLRPFLATQRADIRAALSAKGMAWIDDPSNLDTHYERIRVRQGGRQEAGVEPADIARVAERRTRLSGQAAQLLRDHLTLQHCVLAYLPAAALQGEPDVRRHALATLASFLGGRAHAPGTESMDRIVSVVDDAVPGRVTVGRVIFDRRREGIYLQRECRGLAPAHVAPGTEGLWDGRYRVVNGSDQEVVIGPTPPEREKAQALFADVPLSIAMRAMTVMPLILTRAAENVANIRFYPVVAPFDRFLSQFDLDLARQLAVFCEGHLYPPLPIKLSVRKS
ncbi:tRNA lysidine(34) synthetase TilS [Rhizobium deserti]|uniref:tRNA lysidine(34) synthetase TilS n=1 Tax=Rhizobium deserti TaxID=2547961 RepID=UPI0013869A42|nr:tRNA lysidine(34) synthetase TilS [Rhizobium deserti]